MASYEAFWNEISRIEEVDFDDEKINRLLRYSGRCKEGAAAKGLGAADLLLSLG